MKYACNHPYKFSNWKLAFATAWCHASIVFLIEIANILIICVAFYPIAIVFNFVAVAVITEFDNYVYDALRNEPLTKLLEESEINEKIFVKHHTTSKRCGKHELSTVNDEHGNKRLLRISFGSRTCANKCLFTIYRLYRSFFVSMYFYFMPFICIMFSIIIPLMGERGAMAD